MNTTEQKNSIFTLRSMIFTAIMAAIICVCAPFSIPVPGLLVPISLATFAVYLAGGVLGAKRGALAVLVYILIGAVGLPVFSGFSGGLAKLFGVTEQTIRRWEHDKSQPHSSAIRKLNEICKKNKLDI